MNLLEQADIILINVIFAVFLIRPGRFSKKITALSTAAVFLVVALPQFIFPALFLSDTITTPGQVCFHITYWGVSISIEYILLFILAKRNWLRTLFLYALWDALLSIILGILAVIATEVIPGYEKILSEAGQFLLPLFAAGLALLVLCSAPLKKFNPPGWLCMVVTLTYTLGRLASTVAFFRTETETMQQDLTLAVLILCAVILLFPAAAYLLIGLYADRKCRLNISKQDDSLRDFVNSVLCDMDILCRKRSVRLRSQLTLSGDIVLDNNATACAVIDLLFRILIRYLSLEPGSLSHIICFTAQTEKGYLILSANSFTEYGTVQSINAKSTKIDTGKERLVPSLQCSLYEIVLGRLLNRCHGYSRYLDSDTHSRHLQVIIPLSLHAAGLTH